MSATLLLFLKAPVLYHLMCLSFALRQSLERAKWPLDIDLIGGDISGKFPPSPSLVGVCRVIEISPKRDITVVSKHSSGSACGASCL